MTSADGQVVQSLDFSVGSKKLEEEGAPQLEIVNFRNEIIKEVQTFHDEFLLNFAIVYSTKPDPKFKIGSALLMSAVTYEEASDSVGFNMVFTSSAAWDYYHPSSGESGGGEIENGFIMKSVSKGLFPFASEVKLAGGETVTVAERYMKAYTNALTSAGLGTAAEEYCPDLVYNYATPSSRLRSDSEYSYQDGGLKHHVWLRSSKEYKTKPEISLYVADLNMGYFYLLILIVPLVGLGISIIVIKWREKRKR